MGSESEHRTEETPVSYKGACKNLRLCPFVAFPSRLMGQRVNPSCSGNSIVSPVLPLWGEVCAGKEEGALSLGVLPDDLGLQGSGPLVAEDSSP